MTQASVHRNQLVQALDRLPPLSSGVAKLLSSLVNRDGSVCELAVIVEQDPGLAVRVLQLANSGAYGRSGRVESIGHAISFLGTSVLRRHALSWTIDTVIKRFQTNPAWSMTRFKLHCTATAILVDILCDHLPVQNSDAAYLAGLIHDIGRFFISSAAPEITGQITSLCRCTGKSVVDCERELLGLDHAELSRMAAQKWHLPPAICDALQHHHDVEPLTMLPNPVPLAAALARSDAFVTAAGLSILENDAGGEDAVAWPGYEQAFVSALGSFEVAWRRFTGVDTRPDT